MLLWMILRAALASLLASKLRSILAMLGIIIGVAAVTAMLAIGAGAQKQVTDRIGSMGTDLLILRPAQRGFGGVMSGVQQNLTVEDANALVDLPSVAQVSPVVSGNAQAKYLSRNRRVMINGVAVTYLPIRSIQVERGRAFTEAEVEAHARVALIGPVTAQNLFDQVDPLEATIKVNGLNLRVVGVLKSKGDQGFFSPDDQILVPYTLAMQQLFGTQRLREIDVQAASTDQVETAITAMKTLMRKRHRLESGAEDDVEVRSQAEMLETISSVVRTFTILLGSIAGISLVVGGIGIMNIMLVTVTERTREIGVRKAIGARDRDILRQFLVESVVVSSLGGLIGAGLGIGVALVIGMSDAFAVSIQPFGVAMAMGFAAAVGIFFGWYPAWRAARLDPIEALRYE